ncbi:MAG: LacI family DNA-binding transcriptional regulator, partial [Eubacterium sp.]|nr:LacI family DNA-binding transcriptional regulator [Eubacterium sp.]
MRVTLKQIAEKAGVHISTVDKVLHDRPGVSDAVRAYVQQIIDELGYRPSRAGRTLQRMGKEYHIVVLLLNVDAKPYIMEGIRKVAEESDGESRLDAYDSEIQDAEYQTALI